MADASEQGPQPRRRGDDEASVGVHMSPGGQDEHQIDRLPDEFGAVRPEGDPGDEVFGLGAGAAQGRLVGKLVDHVQREHPTGTDGECGTARRRCGLDGVRQQPPLPAPVQQQRGEDGDEPAGHRAPHRLGDRPLRAQALNLPVIAGRHPATPLGPYCSVVSIVGERASSRGHFG
ncbi:hypothetical protein [Nocardia sp. SSK8]|uniref:hypothetical protein n=1 Tax=Nocardia sp. SSK8 TaxID=3120154 RepID=UPI00300BC5EA